MSICSFSMSSEFFEMEHLSSNIFTTNVMNWPGAGKVTYYSILEHFFILKRWENFWLIIVETQEHVAARNVPFLNISESAVISRLSTVSSTLFYSVQKNWSVSEANRLIYPISKTVDGTLGQHGVYFDQVWQLNDYCYRRGWETDTGKTFLRFELKYNKLKTRIFV